MTSEELLPKDFWKTHYDLVAAIDNNGTSLTSPVIEMLAHIDGMNDEANWHWLVMLESGRFAYITGGCDYTGWDCQSFLDTYEEETTEAALRQVGEAEREQLRAQLPEMHR